MLGSLHFTPCPNPPLPPPSTHIHTGAAPWHLSGPWLGRRGRAQKSMWKAMAHWTPDETQRCLNPLLLQKRTLRPNKGGVGRMGFGALSLHPILCLNQRKMRRRGAPELAPAPPQVRHSCSSASKACLWGPGGVSWGSEQLLRLLHSPHSPTPPKASLFLPLAPVGAECEAEVQRLLTAGASPQLPQ